jgi:hypothetical protein
MRKQYPVSCYCMLGMCHHRMGAPFPLMGAVLELETVRLKGGC